MRRRGIEETALEDTENVTIRMTMFGMKLQQVAGARSINGVDDIGPDSNNLGTNTKSPPALPPCFEQLTPDEILGRTERVLQTTSKLYYDLTEALKPSEATFSNVIRPIIDDANRASSALVIGNELLSHLSPDEAVHQAARQAESRVADARAGNLMRQDVATLVIAVNEIETKTPSGNLDAEDRHLLSRLNAEFISSGAGLQETNQRERLRAASAELTTICSAAQDSLVEPEEGIWFERSELQGVPDTVLATMANEGTHVQATFSKEHTGAILSRAAISATRRRFLIAHWNRLPQNIPRLSKAIALRDEIARLLGFSHHAALKMEKRMALSVEFVRNQLATLHQHLRPVAEAETDLVLELKRADCPGDSACASVLYGWDHSYYANKQRKDESSEDLSLLREYFEVNHTLRAMLMVFHNLFGLEFEPFETSVWHLSVVAYQVWDSPSEGGGFVGYLYADLFARSGKLRGAHCIPLQPGFIESNGTRHYPATVLVCCYAMPTPPEPLLLQHSQLVTMFHELGHAIHNLVSKTKYSLPRSRDYSEIPSNMLENWTWIPEVLVRLGKHYTCLDSEDESEGALPLHLAQALAKTRNRNRANAILAHVWPAVFDLTIHTPSSHAEALDIDTTDIWNRTKQSIITTSCGPCPANWGAGQARFIHMFRHNDAGYFSYPLSMAYAADIFVSEFAKDPMSAAAGRKWRHQVLEHGASRPELEILKSYLGREPSTKSILDELRA